jgi:carbohydrate kinase (thermoresistant glucokinase family)
MSGPAISGVLHAMIVMGVAGSGKTTVAEALAKRIRWAFKDGDAFHPQSNVEKMRSGQPLTDDDRWPWLRAIAAEIDRVIAAGGHVIIACSALKRAYREILVGPRTGVRLIYLKGDRDIILRRLQARRGHFMPPQLLDSQLATLEEPGADERAIAVNIDAPIEAIVDEVLRRLAVN